tara:strand:+ start:1002 stop:1223 length:222 start_codon:yes stop_codon:yes gene_type:complete
MLGQVLDKVYEEYKDEVIFYEVDTEKERELTSMFKVRALPTTVFIPTSGRPEIRPGGMNEDQLKYYLDGFISK